VCNALNSDLQDNLVRLLHSFFSMYVVYCTITLYNQLNCFNTLFNTASSAATEIPLLCRRILGLKFIEPGTVVFLGGRPLSCRRRTGNWKRRRTKPGGNKTGSRK
jgi:hypothetical protein